MIVRNGLALTVPVLFDEGPPTSNVSWTLFSGDSVLASGSEAVAPDALSILLTVLGTHNTLVAPALFATRDLEWSYQIGDQVVNGFLRYTIEARAPLGASADGVRKMLGISKAEVPDSEISLISAYLHFEELATPEGIASAISTPLKQLRMRDAVEALAALDLIPTMPVRVAKSEDSGTNKFARQDVDWQAVADYLSKEVNDGILAARPGYNVLDGAGTLFILATPAIDGFTGSAPSAQ